MEIRIKDSTDKYELAEFIETFIENHTRFTIGAVLTDHPRIRNGIKLREVRLKEKKPYCGNHPAECELLPWQSEEPKRRMAKYLEGADWVEFNDWINDMLDYMQVNANVRTSILIIRKGKHRRVEYGYHRDGNFTQWNEDEDDDAYKNWMDGYDTPGASEYPFGTPGTYERTADGIDWYLAQRKGTHV